MRIGEGVGKECDCSITILTNTVSKDMESMLDRIRNPSCRKSHTIVFCLFVCKPKIGIS